MIVTCVQKGFDCLINEVTNTLAICKNMELLPQKKEWSYHLFLYRSCFRKMLIKVLRELINGINIKILVLKNGVFNFLEL